MTKQCASFQQDQPWTRATNGQIHSYITQKRLYLYLVSFNTAQSAICTNWLILCRFYYHCNLHLYCTTFILYEFTAKCSGWLSRERPQEPQEQRYPILPCRKRAHFLCLGIVMFGECVFILPRQPETSPLSFHSWLPGSLWPVRRQSTKVEHADAFGPRRSVRFFASPGNVKYSSGPDRSIDFFYDFFF